MKKIFLTAIVLCLSLNSHLLAQDTNGTTPITLSNAADVVELNQIGYGTIRALDWLPESNKLVATTSTNAVFYDENSLNNGVPSSILDGSGGGRIFDASHTENGTIFALQRYDRSVFLRYDTGRIVEIPNGVEHIYLRGSAFSPDGSLLAIGAQSDWGSSKVSIWDTSTGALIGEVEDSSGAYVDDMKFSPAGDMLIYSGYAGVYMWNIATPNEASILFTTEDLDINSFAGSGAIKFNFNGNRVAIGGYDEIAPFVYNGTVTIWNTNSQEIEFIANTSTEEVSSISFSPNGEVIAVGSDRDDTIALLSTTTGAVLTTIQTEEEITYNNLQFLTFNRDGNLLASAGIDTQIKIWDSATGELVETLTGYASALGDIDINPIDNTMALSVRFESRVQIWDIQTLTLQNDIAIDASRIWSLQFDAEGIGLFVSGDPIGTDYWINAEPTETAQFGHASSDIAVSPRGDMVAINNTIWNISENRLIRSLRGHEDSINDLDFSPDGSILASVSGLPYFHDGHVPENSLRLWDVATGDQIWAVEFSSSFSSLFSVAFNPQGDIVATGDTDGRITLYDVNSGAEVRTLTGHAGAVNALLFSSDGSIIVSAGDDFTVRLWDVATGTEIKRLEEHGHLVVALALNVDGTLLASASWDGTVRLWGIPADE